MVVICIRSLPTVYAYMSSKSLIYLNNDAMDNYDSNGLVEESKETMEC